MIFVYFGACLEVFRPWDYQNRIQRIKICLYRQKPSIWDDLQLDFNDFEVPKMIEMRNEWNLDWWKYNHEGIRCVFCQTLFNITVSEVINFPANEFLGNLLAAV